MNVSTESRRESLSERQLSPLVAVVVAAIVATVSWCVISFDWVMFDDDINILVNPFLGRGAASSVTWAYTQFDYIRRYLPLGWLSFDALLSVDGYNATVFHAAGLLLNALNAALAFLVFLRLLSSEPLTAQGPSVAPARQLVVAAVVALAWSTHPLRAENAGWISGLLYLGSTTFALLALLLYLGDRSSPIRAAGAVIAFTLSLLWYPVFLALPLVLLWREVCTGRTCRDGFVSGIRRLWSWFFVAAALAAINGYALRTANAGFAISPENRLGPLEWLRLAAITSAHYAARTLWPSDLAADYGSIEHLFHPIAARLALGIVVIGMVAAAISRRTRRAAAGWTIAFVLSLAPVLAQLDASFNASDRYAVLWLIVAGAGVATWLARPRSRRADRFLGLGALAILIALATSYRSALQPWRNTQALQANIDRVRADEPEFSRAAAMSWWMGQGNETSRRLKEGLRRFPSSPSLIKAAHDLAIMDQRWRVRVGSHTEIPPIAVYHYDLGRAWLGRGERAAAAAHFARALALAPSYADAAREYRRCQDGR